MFTYEQTTGRLTHNAAYIGTGWAGQGAGKNNPAMQNVPGVGPLPQGFYKIGPAYHHLKLGPVTMNLTPDPRNEMYGRAAFRIHGFAADDPSTPENERELSSEGCICQIRPVRERIRDSGDRDLEVIA